MRKKRKVKIAKKPTVPVLRLDDRNRWLVKNFLLPLEKRALIMFYQTKISSILEATKRDDTKDLDVECEHDIKRFSSRIRFIVEHF